MEAKQPKEIQTRRLRLVPVTPELSRLERIDRVALAERLGAEVPDNWPPEILADVQDYFDDLLTEHPDWVGWLGWYVLQREDSVLVASIGFHGPPDAHGQVEIGYSVLPQFQQRGYATEMAGALIDWALQQEGVRAIRAEVNDANNASLAVLKKLAFARLGPGTELGDSAYRLAPDDLEQIGP